MKLREGSLDNSTCSDVSVNNEDPFTEAFKFPECVSILTNDIRNLETQIGQIFKMLKGECQLTDLTKGVDFITQEFDEYEKDQCEKDTIIATLQIDLKSISMNVKNHEKKMDRQEQYRRRNYILIHGLKEEKNGRTDDRVLGLFGKELNEDILIVDLDRTHRIGQKRD